MKIVLAGSPQISINTFKAIIDSFDVVAIITQPDKQKGRGMKLQQTPVSSLAIENNIKLFKPAKISEIHDELLNLNFDLLLTFAYGQKIPNSILEMGTKKPLNIHGSLLPKYRGAAPIHRAIMNGDSKIGITLMEMTEKMDAGDMYFKASQKINSLTSTGDGFEIIDNLACTNIVSWIKNISKNEFSPEKQGLNFTIAKKVTKEEGLINGDCTFSDAERKIRGLNPFPGAYSYINNKRVKIFNFSLTKILNSPELILKDKIIYLSDYQFENKSRKNLI